MNILLVQNGTYVPTHGGATKANRMLLEGLAARGHRCTAIVPATMQQGADTQARLLAELDTRQIDVRRVAANVVIFEHQGVEVHAVTNAAQLRAYTIQQIRSLAPTWTLVAAEDPAQVLLKAALEASPDRVVYVAQTTLLLPFGPMCFQPSPAKAALVRQAAGVLTLSHHLKAYMQRWGQVTATVIPFPVYGTGPFPRLGRADHGAVTMINPSAVKGISIFAALAQRFPQVPFAAVPTWATTADNRATLAALPNVRLLPPADDIDQIFAQTRILLVPSLWDEAFGYITVEAMLRGIPVLASDVGGLPEAKLGVPYVLPVAPITHYQAAFDDRMCPVADVPAQDITPWAEALHALLSDPTHYTAIADASAAAAHAFVAQLGIAPFERFLETLTPGAQQDHQLAQHEIGATSEHSLLDKLNHLSPEKRALLARQLAHKDRSRSS